ncbi:MAG TPA: helix-turn-helix domain-containing protein [Jatrophihabitans sp.]|nr:helix-turn-helix domain-containing protein [Jatrophihabitans sp.]
MLDEDVDTSPRAEPSAVADPLTAAWETQRAAMGAFIRSQRELANMSLRELSRATQVSNAYLSQLERGRHDPSVRVLQQVAEALHLSVADVLRECGAMTTTRHTERGGVEQAVRADPDLSPAEKDALLSVYRSYRRGHRRK